MKIRIVVTKRSSDYRACIEGQSKLWAAARTPYEAIGNLIKTHPEKFGIEIIEIPKPK